MESDYSTLCNELDNIFLECPTDKSGCAEVQSLIDAFVNKYGNEKPQLRSIISDKLDPGGFNPSISRSCFKRLIMEWIVSYHHEGPVSHYMESAINVDKDVFEYDATSYAHSTPLGRFNQRARKIPQKKLSYSPALGFTSDSLENQVSPYREELKSFKSASKAHNSSLENSLVKAEQKIFALEEEMRTLKLHSRKDTERFKEEINQLKHFEKLYAGSVNKVEKYAETLNNITKEYNRLKNSKEDLFKEYTNLEIDYQRLQNEIGAKNISLKALETWKRVQTEELVALNDSKTMLESEVFKLKIEVKGHSENEESLLLRIGELQSEKQKLQTELNEVMNFEKLKMAASSPFGKSVVYEDIYMDRSEENRESGISVRSELMDSLGFTSCINETFNLPYLSALNGTDGVSFTCGATAIDLLNERYQKIEQEVQTEQIGQKRLQFIEKDSQTETLHEKTRFQKVEKEVQTEQICETRVQKVEKEIQTEKICETRLQKIEKEIQTEQICEKRAEKIETEVQMVQISETRIPKLNTGMLTEVISTRSSEPIQKGVQTDQIKEKRILKVEKSSQTDVICETRFERQILLEASMKRDSPENVGVNTFQWSFMDNTLDCLTPTKMDIDSSLEEFHRSISGLAYHGITAYDGCELTSDDNGWPTNTSALNTENDSLCSSSSDRSIPAYEIIPVLRKPNMSTPRLRIKRMESRRLSCLDIYNKPVSICRPNSYQKMTFSRKISTIFTGIISILSPGVRICMKTLVWLVTASLVFVMMVIVMLIVAWKHDGIPQQFLWPYVVLKYPSGPPPT
ncbi:centrosomal protein of 63 kDa-B isoform X2 [Halyomorpha halys]|uniref:centrosomal protein of 63 kDa-B isoform X2 n=1 Tax=Halyomorpha halys TaxID=286706 RepID=UPI0006D4DB72|nr:centromere-associated protein E isoform X2 [Halyomorpha halys]